MRLYDPDVSGGEVSLRAKPNAAYGGLSLLGHRVPLSLHFCPIRDESGMKWTYSPLHLRIPLFSLATAFTGITWSESRDLFGNKDSERGIWHKRNSLTQLRILIYTESAS